MNLSVTPCVGVWIEILPLLSGCGHLLCHSLCGSVDWNCFPFCKFICYLCHSLCGSVDWNWNLSEELLEQSRHSLCGSVDWNSLFYSLCWYFVVTPCVGVWIEISKIKAKYKDLNCHSLCGSVDWNFFMPSVCFLPGVTPCVGVWIEIWTSSVRPLTARAVTPCVGVWIEIHALGKSACKPRSLPAWECGLK